MHVGTYAVLFKCPTAHFHLTPFMNVFSEPLTYALSAVRVKNITFFTVAVSIAACIAGHAGLVAAAIVNLTCRLNCV